MTYGPGGQPPGPPQQPPPPPGGYGPPPPAASNSGFDAKSVNPLDWGILGAAALAFVFSFFSYYSAKADFAAVAKAFGGSTSDYEKLCANPGQAGVGNTSALDAFCNGETGSAWHGFFGWFGVLLALVGAGAVAVALFAPQLKLPVPARLASLGAFALAVVSTLLALLIVPVGDVSLPGGVNADDVIDTGHGFSYWVVLVLVVVGLVLAFLRFQQTGGQVSAAGASAPGVYPPPSGPTGYGQPGDGNQPGYGTPPLQGGSAYPPPSAPPSGQNYPPSAPPSGQNYPPPQQ